MILGISLSRRGTAYFECKLSFAVMCQHLKKGSVTMMQMFLTRCVCTGMGLAVVGLLFQYLGMLQREGLQSWAYSELAAIAATKFQYANEEEACDYVTRLAADMLHYEPQHTLNADSLYQGWDAGLVSSALTSGRSMCPLKNQTRFEVAAGQQRAAMPLQHW